MKIFLIATLDPTMSFVWSEILGLEKRVKDEEHPYNNPYFWAGFMVVGA
jgi:CHAT domain-containing protein